MTDQEIFDRNELWSAYHYASEFSQDPRTQVGAIIIDKNHNKAWGTNRFPFLFETNEKILENKNKYMVHAELDAICDAASMEVCTSGAIMYAPWFACSNCAKAIIQAGIEEVVGHKLLCIDKPHKKWEEDIKLALSMFDQAKVKYRYYDGKIGDVKILFDGELIEP